MQKEIKIGDIRVPVIHQNGEKWYPVSYINKQFLGRPKVTIVELRNYQQYVAKLVVNYTFLKGYTNIQEVNCISEEGLKEWLQGKVTSRMSVKQKKMYNLLCEYLGLDQIEAKARYCYGFDKVRMGLYNEHDTFVLTEYFSLNQDNQKLQLCSCCGNYLPYSGQFFLGNIKHGIESKCLRCAWGDGYFKAEDFKYKGIYDVFGFEVYQLYKSNEIVAIYNHYCSHYNEYVDNGIIPKVLVNKGVILDIIKGLYFTGVIDIGELNSKDIMNKHCLDLGVEIRNLDIHNHIFGKDCIYYIWKYPCLVRERGKLTFEQAKKIFLNYVNEHNIIMDNIFSFDYFETFKKCGVRTFAIKYDVLAFIRDLYNRKYGAYEFKYASVNHYKSQENRIIAMKHFVINNIPAFEDLPKLLTRRYLYDACNKLNRVLVSQYDGDIYEWVDECYPNAFQKESFDLEVLRENKFDSIEEMQIDYMLRKSFYEPSRLIYNQNHFDIGGIEPDWIYIGAENAYMIEYFGLYNVNQIDNSNIINDYMERYNYKMEKYKNIKGYKTLFLYPEDLKDKFKGLKDKFAAII